MRRRLWRIVAFSLLFLALWTFSAYGEEPFASALQELDLERVEEFLQGEPALSSLTFSEVMKRLSEGDLLGLWDMLLSSLQTALFSELQAGGKRMGQVLALGIFGAIFMNFSNVLGNGQISETGFYAVSLLLFALLLAGFHESAAVAVDTVDKSLSFMKVVAPVFFLAVAFSGGSLSAAVMYEFTLTALGAGQWLLQSVLIPLTRVFLLVSLAGNLVKEDFLSRMTRLSERAVVWGLKTLLGLVLGFHLIQNLILPYVDSLKNGSAQKLLSMIPGIGQGAEAVTTMVLASGVLVKNTMGMAAVVLLFLLLAVPVLKLLILYGAYVLLAAVMEPVCDKRLVASVEAAAKASGMLLKIVATAALLLILTVAVVCAGTNATYFG